MAPELRIKHAKAEGTLCPKGAADWEVWDLERAIDRVAACHGARRRRGVDAGRSLGGLPAWLTAGAPSDDRT